MTSQQVFWISAVIGVIFIALFLVPRSKKDPSRLRMEKDKKFNDPVPVTRKNFSTMSREAKQSSAGEVRMKSLNVMFNYNGHSWDAHEVLGVPAGAPLEMVKKGYEASLKNTDPSSHDFIETAFQAIMAELRGK